MDVLLLILYIPINIGHKDEKWWLFFNEKIMIKYPLKCYMIYFTADKWVVQDKYMNCDILLVVNKSER